MLELRAHQKPAIDIILATETGRDLIRMATGSGKTIIIIRVVHEYVQRGQRALILVNKDHLVRQVVDRFHEFYPEYDYDIGIVQGKRREWHKKIVVATIQTAYQDTEFMPTDFALVCTDEAHRGITPTFFKLYQRLGLINAETFAELCQQADGGGMKKTQQKKVFALRKAIKDVTPDDTPRKHLGFTATPHRTDDLGLGLIFSGIAYDCSVKELVGKKQLCDLTILPVIFRLKKSELRAMLRDGKADEKAVKLWQEYASDRKHTIGFCMNISHAESLAKTFRENGIHAEALHSKLSPEVRQQREHDFRTGKLPVLTNVNVFVEGFDVPNLDCIVFARDTDSATFIPQALGRGMRKSTEKHDCYVIAVGAEINPDELSKSADIFRNIQIAKGSGGRGGFKGFIDGHAHPMTINALQTLFNVIQHTTDHYAWIPYLEKQGVALAIDQNRWYCIGKQPDGKYAASFDLPKYRKRPAKRHLVCRDKDSIDECKDACIRHMAAYDIRVNFGRRDQAVLWRTQMISEKQKALLQKFGVEVSQSCTRGEASDMISTIYRNIKETP